MKFRAGDHRAPKNSLAGSRFPGAEYSAAKSENRFGRLETTPYKPIRWRFSTAMF
jgi:hypothetical protein